MATIDLGSPPPAPRGVLGALPRRVSLTMPELRLVADHAGGAPLPFDRAPDRNGAHRAGRHALRLGPVDAGADADAYAAALAALHDPRSSLSRRGLLVDTEVDEGLLGAVGLLAKPTLALDLDVTAGDARVKAWHRQHEGAVASLATADGIVFELAWFPADRWGDELARVTAVPEDLPPRPSAVPADVDLPLELADAALEAVRSGRSDLISVLVANHPGRAYDEDGDPLPDLDVAALLAALAGETRGRMRALAADVSTEATVAIGVVSWVLLADGWRALRPRRAAGADRVVVARVEPGDLARELAPVLAEVSA